MAASVPDEEEEELETDKWMEGLQQWLLEARDKPLDKESKGPMIRDKARSPWNLV